MRVVAADQGGGVRSAFASYYRVRRPARTVSGRSFRSSTFIRVSREGSGDCGSICISRLWRRHPAFLIHFDNKDRFTAQKVTGDVVSRFIEESIRRGTGLQMTLELLDPPSLPLNPIFPNRPMVAGTGLFIGLAAAVGLGLWRYFRAPLPAVAAQ